MWDSADNWDVISDYGFDILHPLISNENIGFYF